MSTDLALSLLFSVTPTPPTEFAPMNLFDLNTIVSGSTGFGLAGLIYLLIKTLIDRTLPSRSDARASAQLVLESLNNMVKVLQQDKESDRVALERKQVRINELETAADVDYDRVRELRAEIIELQNRLSQKDRHITTLVRELRRVGADVTGLDLDDVDVTYPPTGVRLRSQNTSSDLQNNSTNPSVPL